MPFTIPNFLHGAAYPTLSEPDSVDFDALVGAFNQTGVLSGCAVTAQVAPDMTVAVAGGTISSAGVTAAVAPGNVPITTADATNPRYDLIVASSSGVKSAIAGTPLPSNGTTNGLPEEAVYPPIPAGSVLLEAVYVPANATAITTALITDKRVLLGPLPESRVTNLVTDLAAKAALVHVHAAADVTSGTMATARLGSGVADATTFLRGDQTYAVPSGGSSFTGSAGFSIIPTADNTYDLGAPAFRWHNVIAGAALQLPGGNIQFASGTTVPATLASDNFNRADSASLGTAPTGQTWLNLINSAHIISNQAGSPDADAYLDVLDCGAADVAVQITITAFPSPGASYIGILVRASDGSNYFRAIINNGTLYLDKRVAGALTNLATGMASGTPGDILKVQVLGPAITVYYNGSVVATASDSFNQSVTQHGIFIYGTTGLRLDDFLITAVPTVYDTFLVRAGVGALAQRNGVNPQTFIVTNTYTDESNYERLALRWAGNVVTVGPLAAGSGTVRGMILGASTGAGMGLYGHAPAVQPVAAAAATDLASVITLANSLRTGLQSNGSMA
jgi:hypothetical protein